MSETTAIVEGTSALQTIQPQTPTPMLLLQMALTNNAGIETVERLVALQERMQAHAAEQEWAAAMSRCQSEMGRISADADNPQTKSKYASYAKMDGSLRPIYTRHGFALSYGTEDLGTERILVYCDVSHSQGHSKRFTVPMPADGKGAKGGDVMTKTHATGAAMSYGMRYLLKMIFNVAVGEDDRDGNLPVDEGEIERNRQYIQSARNKEELQAFWAEVYTPAYNATPRKTEACKAYLQARDIRAKELK